MAKDSMAREGVISTLIVEDDPVLADAHAEFVARVPGFAAAGIAHLGAEALRLVATRRVDLLLLDVNLPDMTGIDILRRIKENEHIRRTPVVVLTTTDDEKEIQRCYDLGCNVYITKPVNYENFANAIRQLGLFFAVIQVPTPV